MRAFIAVVFVMVLVCGCASGSRERLTVDAARRELGGRPGAFVLMDVASAGVLRVNEAGCAEPWAPCSTFKIWNTLIALELGLVASPDEPFYRWDGRRRSIDAWNQDLTLRDAFAASCVPAFQALAERIGPARMQDWLDRIGYGDGDISAGVTEFWLPEPGRKTLLISADGQASLLRQFVRQELSFSPQNVSVLREIMRVRGSERGTLFGKTGTGRVGQGPEHLAWFVGWIESSSAGGTRTFACVVRGTGVMGADVRGMVERVLGRAGWL